MRAALRRLPRGSYRFLSAMPHMGRFHATLAQDVGGARFACDLSDTIAHEAYFTGIYEPPVTRVVQAYLSGGAVCVDAGANWGYFTLVAAAAVGAAGRVIALEPDPRMRDALEENVDLNGFVQVATLAVAAASHEGRGRLAGYADSSANRGVSRLADANASGPVFDVRCATIDDLTADVRRVDLLKIDVEGAEYDVLRGMRDGLASSRYGAIVLELHPELLRARGVSPAACIDLLRDAGYEGWTIDVSPRTYRRARDPRVRCDELLGPLDAWTRAPWPHLLWRKC
jgi:FkbM family methyltransferase